MCPKNGQREAFEYVTPVKDSGLAVVIPARGAAFGDLFNDGKIDVIINPIDGPPVLLRNVNPDHHHWVEMQLVGGSKSPRDATCSTVYLKANGMRMRQDVLASGSYISSNDRRLHFGLATPLTPALRRFIVFRSQGDGKAACGRSHLHHYGGQRNYRRGVRRQPVLNKTSGGQRQTCTNLAAMSFML